MDRDYEEPFDDEEHWTAEIAEDALSLPPEWVTVGPDVTDAVLGHPSESGLRGDRLPHIWCPGCGIGIAVTCFVKALDEADIDRDSLSVVSGIGCTGRVAGYMDCDSFHTIHGRAVPFALGLHLGNPELKVVVFSGDGDLVAIGGNHLIHAARRNADITVFCVNNFTYGMTGGQSGPTTQEGARTSTTPYGSVEHAFNLPLLVAAAGATYVARWTVLDLGRLRRSMVEALQHQGFRLRRDRLSVPRLLRPAQPPRRGDRRAPLLPGEHRRRELRAAGGAGHRPGREDRRREVRREGAAHVRGAARGDARPQGAGGGGAALVKGGRRR